MLKKNENWIKKLQTKVVDTMILEIFCNTVLQYMFCYIFSKRKSYEKSQWYKTSTTVTGFILSQLSVFNLTKIWFSLNYRQQESRPNKNHPHNFPVYWICSTATLCKIQQMVTINRENICHYINTSENLKERSCISCEKGIKRYQKSFPQVSKAVFTIAYPI